MSVWTRTGGPSAARRRVTLWALCGALPILSLGYQIAAKETALALTGVAFGWGWLGRLMQQPSVLALLALEIASFAAWMTALSEMKLSAAFPISALSYVLIILTSWTIYGEPATLAQVCGGALILLGIWRIGHHDAEAEAPR